MAGIRHIEFWVSDLEKSLRFYHVLFSVLGWDQVDKTAFRYGETKMYFCQGKDVDEMNLRVFGPRHFCFEAGSVKKVDMISRLSEVKGRILHGPAVLRDGGSYMLVFKDPDGYILEVAHDK